MRAVKKMLKKRKAEEAAELERSDSWDLEQPFRSAYYEAFLECERNAGFSDPAFAPVNGETTPTPLNRPWWDCVSPPGSPAYVPPPTADDEFWSTVDFEREVEVGRIALPNFQNGRRQSCGPEARARDGGWPPAAALGLAPAADERQAPSFDAGPVLLRSTGCTHTSGKEGRRTDATPPAFAPAQSQRSGARPWRTGPFTGQLIGGLST